MKSEMTPSRKKIRFPLSAQYGGAVFLLALASLFAGCQQGRQTEVEEAWTPSRLESDQPPPADGREVIQRMADFMSAQQELMTEAFVTFAVIQDSGQLLHFDLLQRVAIRKPDKFYWRTLRDDASVDTAWFSDGRFTMFKQPANLWGQIDGPKTFYEMVTLLVEEYDIDVPFRDLLTKSPTEVWLSEDITSIVYVGEAWVEGAWSDHVALRKPGVDFEVWVRKGPEPLLAKLAITYSDAEGQPTYTARFRKWATHLSDSIDFDFTPPPDSERIEVVPVVDVESILEEETNQ